jgi:hypothetical protein
MSPKKILALAATVAMFWVPKAQSQTQPDSRGAYSDSRGAAPSGNTRSAYSYVREVDGQVTVVSEANGSVEARRNLPISAGDSLSTEDPARAEIAMADGNLLQVGGGTHLKFTSLAGQQGSDDEVSAIDLSDGSVILSVVSSEDRSIPRIDTDDLSVYANLGSRVRVNGDPRHGSAVIVRAGSVEVRSRTGSYTVRAGNYLTVNGEEEPEIARGDFSRDRFDGWAADRLESYSEATRSASSKYVGEDYAGDTQSLDGYGDWQYNDDYGTEVWRPNVDASWSPYSNGSWYYTPAGLSWWSWDPWGWFPFHYGNWCWNAGWNSWCWSPGYVYSPAWCYYGYSGGYFGWCPTGWYGGGHGGNWGDGHGGHGGHGGWNGGQGGNGGPGGGAGSGGGSGVGTRGQVVTAINGRYATRNVDLRGWNFTNASNVGQVGGRLAVTPGSRLTGRLGDQIAVSSRPIVVDRAATAGGVRAALQDHIRQAPQTIERTASRDSQALAPVLSRQQNLSQETLDAVSRHTAVVDRGRVSGPGASDVAPRGATIVDRGVESSRTDAVRREDRGGRNPMITNRATGNQPADRGRTATGNGPTTAPAPDRSARPEISRQPSAPQASESWRNRPNTQVQRPTQSDRGATRAPELRDARPSNSNQARADAWRESNRPAPQGRGQEPVQRGTQSWRSRSDVPPARRVIEGAVPNRRSPSPESGRSGSWRQSPAQRDSGARNRDVAPPRRSFDAPRDYIPRQRPNSAPSRDFAPRQAPPSRSFDHAPAPSREAPRPSAPSAPSRSSPSFSSPRSSPPSHSPGRPGRN